MGSIPAGAFLLFFFYLLFPILSLLLLGLVAQWKRVCLLSRRLWVRPPPGSCSHYIFIHPIDSHCCALLFPLLIFPFPFFVSLILIPSSLICPSLPCLHFLPPSHFPSPLLSDHFLFSLPYPVSKGGRVVQGGSLRYCSLRRRGFEPHPLHFDFFLLHFLSL